MKKPWIAVPCKEKKTSTADSARLRKPTITNLPGSKEETVTEYDVLRWISEHFHTEMEDLELEKKAYKTKISNSKRVNTLKESYNFNTKARPDLEFNSPFIVTKKLPTKNSEPTKKCSSKKMLYSKPESREVENLASAVTIKSKTHTPKYEVSHTPKNEVSHSPNYDVSKCNANMKSNNLNGTKKLPISDYRSILEKENVDIPRRRETKKDMYESLGLEKSIQANSCRQLNRDNSNLFKSKFIKLNSPESFETFILPVTDTRKIFDSDDCNLTNRKKKRVKSRSAPKQKIPQVQETFKPKIINLPRCKSAVFTSSWKTNNSKIQVRRDETEGKGRNIRRNNNESFVRSSVARKVNKVPIKPVPWVQSSSSSSSDAVYKKNTAKSSMTTFQATLLRAAYRVAARQLQLQQNQAEQEMADGDYNVVSTSSSMNDRIVDLYPKRGPALAKGDARYWEE